MTRRRNVQPGQARPRPGLPLWLITVIILAAAIGVGCILGAPGAGS